MHRFVILRHEFPPASKRADHWDLMLETEGVLRTWALDDLPRKGRPADATALTDHRLAYLDLEGPVSGDRGHVARYDRGIYRIELQSTREWIIDIDGEYGHSRWRLFRKSEHNQDWSVEVL